MADKSLASILDEVEQIPETPVSSPIQHTSSKPLSSILDEVEAIPEEPEQQKPYIAKPKVEQTPLSESTVAQLPSEVWKAKNAAEDAVASAFVGAGRGALQFAGDLAVKWPSQAGDFVAKQLGRTPAPESQIVKSIEGLSTPTQFETWSADQTEKTAQELAKSGIGYDIAYRISQGVGSSFAQTAAMVGGAGALGKAEEGAKAAQTVWQSVKQSLPHAAKFAGLVYTTTPGDTAERAKAAAHAFALGASGSLAGWLPNPVSQKLAGLAINVAFNSPAYADAVAKAKEQSTLNGRDWKTNFAASMAPTMMLDLLFGLVTPNLRAQQKALQLEVADAAKKSAAMPPPLPESAKVSAEPPPLPAETLKPMPEAEYTTDAQGNVVEKPTSPLTVVPEVNIPPKQGLGKPIEQPSSVAASELKTEPPQTETPAATVPTSPEPAKEGTPQSNVPLVEENVSKVAEAGNGGVAKSKPIKPMDRAIAEAQSVLDSVGIDTKMQEAQVKREIGKIALRYGLKPDVLRSKVLWTVKQPKAEATETTPKQVEVEVKRSGEKFEIFADGKKVGQAFIKKSTANSTGFTLDAIDINENQQRKGYGTKLLSEIGNYLKSVGATSLHSSNEGSGTVQMLEKVFPGKAKHFVGTEEIPTEKAIQIMDKDFGYTRSVVDLRSPKPAAPATESVLGRSLSDQVKELRRQGFNEKAANDVVDGRKGREVGAQKAEGEKSQKGPYAGSAEQDAITQRQIKDENNNRKAYIIAQGFVFKDGEWTHPDYPGKTIYSDDVPNPTAGRVRKELERIRKEQGMGVQGETQRQDTGNASVLHKVGEYVYFRTPVIAYKDGKPFSTTKNVRAKVMRIKPDGSFEVKSQEGDYYTKKEGEVSSEPAAKPSPAAPEAVTKPAESITKPELMTPEELLKQYDDGEMSASEIYEILKAKESNTPQESKAIAEYERGYAEYVGNGMRMDNFAEEYMMNELLKKPTKIKQSKKVEIPQELQGPETFKKEPGYHRSVISIALNKKLPVNATAVDTYKIKIPEGYVREGDRYVFKGDAKPEVKAETPPPPVEPPIPPKQGFGEAKPNGPEPVEGSIGLSRRAIAEKEGLVIPPEFTGSDADAMVRAAEKTKANPEAGRQAVDAIIDDPSMGASKDQQALVLHEYNAQRNILNEQLEARDKARKNGDANAEGASQRLIDEALERKERAIAAGASAASRAGASLQFVKTMIKENWDVTTLNAETKAREGVVTEDALAKNQAMADKMKGLLDKVEVREKQTEDLQFQNEILQKQKEAKKRERTTKFKGKAEEVSKKAISKGDSLIAEGLAGLQADLGLGKTHEIVSATAKMVTMTAKTLVNLSKIGAGVILKGAGNSAKFSLKMKEVLGEHFNKFEAHMQKVYEESRKLSAATLMKELSDAPEKGTLKEHRADIRKIGDSILLEAKDGYDFSKKLHELVKQVFPDATEKEVREVYSNYGEQTKVSTDTMDVARAKMTRVELLISKLTDAAAKVSPLKTGRERAAHTPEERALHKELNKLLKDNGLDAGNRENRIKSAVDAVKTRLENQKIDLDKAIAKAKSGEALLPTKGKPVVKSEVIKQLESERDALQAQLDAFYPKDATQPAAAYTQDLNRASKRLADWRKRLTDAQSGKFVDVMGKTVKATSKAVAEIKSEIEASKAAIKQLEEQAFPKANQPADMIEKMIDSAEASLAKADQKLADAKAGKWPTPKTPVEANRIVAELQAYREKAKRAYDELYDAAYPAANMPASKYKSLQAAANRKLAALKSDVATGEWKPKIKNEKWDLMSKEDLKIAEEIQKLEEQRANQKYKYEFSKMTKGEQAWEYAKGGQEIIKALSASFDQSAPGVQGWALGLARPRVWAKAHISMFASMSKLGSMKEWEKIKSDSWFEWYKKSDLAVIKGDGKGGFKGADDIVLSSLAQKIPGVQWSTRTFATFMNSARTAAFKEIVKANFGSPEKASLVELQGVAALVNNLSSVSNLKGHGPTLALALWTPKKIGAAFARTTWYTIWGQRTWKLKGIAAKEKARAGATLAIIYGLNYLLNPDSDVDFNTISSSFGQISLFGKKWQYNPIGDSVPLLIALSQTIAGMKKYGNDYVNIRKGSNIFASKEQEAKGVGSGTSWEKNVLIPYLKSKRTPGIGAVTSFVSGEDFMGKPQTVKDLLANTFTPMVVSSIVQASRTLNPIQAGAMGVASFYGQGVKPQYKNLTPAEKGEPTPPPSKLPRLPSRKIIPSGIQKYNEQFKNRRKE